ncbi:MAG: SMP-30/gluconolactonase/LRE family protein [Gammaproteobacteria bacterium]|nr:SMP-30/gluconolactonase/LRE family protein [Gammaproteobacteria bacterium]MDH4254348.1 SMP-30/gluconolactonase/LRE family protein [Gammaproteobacteria bacterium]MDH5309600.1 SMP-30/gluconolactonase/LRE family protein [Gammaproteobacteria bacterium]
MSKESALAAMRSLLFAAFILCGGWAAAQNDIEKAQAELQAANASYRAGDFEGFTRSLERALELNPASLYTRYNLACAYARTGRADEAIPLLEGLVTARVDFGMADDPDLESLHERDDFRALVAKLEAGIAPVSNSHPRYTLQALGVMPEGIAADPATGRLFFGSMRSGDIFVLDPDNQLSRFATVEHSGRRAAVGMAVDTRRGLLWSTGTSFFMNEDFDEEAPAPSGLFSFDLATGDLRGHYFTADDGLGVNDVAISPSGEVWSTGAALRRLDEATGRLEPVAVEPPVFGSNGIAFTPDGGTLFVSSYPVGLVAIDVSSGRSRVLDSPADAPLYGVDGLYWYDGDLVAVQNGVQPWRLLRLRLNEDRTAVASVRVIEFANPALTPMTGAILDGEIHYIGRAPAPESPPGHFPAELAEFLGATLIMTAPLD